MPKFEYRALTRQGQIVTNKIVETSRSACIKKIKRNGLIPISVKQAVGIEIDLTQQELDDYYDEYEEDDIKEDVTEFLLANINEDNRNYEVADNFNEYKKIII